MAKIIVILQAVSGGGIVLFVFGILALILIPVLIHFFMKIYQKMSNASKDDIENKPYYKDPVPFLIVIILSVIVFVGILYLLVILLDMIFPSFE